MRRVDGWRQNLGLKILSVVLALLLWSFVHGTKIVEREISLPVRCVNLPDSLVLLADPPREARVVLSGAVQEFVLEHVWPKAELRLDLSHARRPLVRVTPDPAAVALGGFAHLSVVRVAEPVLIELPVGRRN
jgi:hypothetical protein